MTRKCFCLLFYILSTKHLNIVRTSVLFLMIIIAVTLLPWLPKATACNFVWIFFSIKICSKTYLTVERCCPSREVTLIKHYWQQFFSEDPPSNQPGNFNDFCFFSMFCSFLLTNTWRAVQSVEEHIEAGRGGTGWSIVDWFWVSC